MSYSYEKERSNLFTDEGVRMLLQIREKVQRLLTVAGCFRVGNAISGVTGDTWLMLACLDYIAELGEIKLVTDSGSRQNWIMRGTTE